MTGSGLYPFDPLAVDRSKLRPGDQYQQKKDNPDANLHLLVDVAHEDFIPEDTVILQTAPISPLQVPVRSLSSLLTSTHSSLHPEPRAGQSQSMSHFSEGNDSRGEKPTVGKV